MVWSMSKWKSFIESKTCIRPNVRPQTQCRWSGSSYQKCYIQLCFTGDTRRDCGLETSDSCCAVSHLLGHLHVLSGLAPSPPSAVGHLDSYNFRLGAEAARLWRNTRECKCPSELARHHEASALRYQTSHGLYLVLVELDLDHGPDPLHHRKSVHWESLDGLSEYQLADVEVIHSTQRFSPKRAVEWGVELRKEEGGVSAIRRTVAVDDHSRSFSVDAKVGHHCIGHGCQVAFR